MRFIFKICQIVAGTGKTRQFLRNFQSNFWRVYDVWPNCVLGRASTDQLDISSMLMATVCTAGILHPGGHE